MSLFSEQNNAQLDAFAASLSPVLRQINLHRFFWLLFLVCGFVAWNRGLALLYSLVALVLAVLLLSYLLSWLNIRGIRVSRTFPEIVEAGTPFDIRYTVSALGRRSFIHIQEQDLIVDDSTEDVDEEQKSLDAEDRVEQDEEYSPSPMIFIDHLGRKPIEIDYILASPKRGVYSMQRLLLTCGYPFGVVEQKQTLELPAQMLTVLPRMFEIEHLPCLIANQSRQGEVLSRSAGQHDEFAGLREYRRGDAMKTIHWGATARQIARQQPWQVKTYESNDSPSLLIVLNQLSLSESAFELMLSIVASMVRHASYSGTPVIVCGGTSVRDEWQVEIMPHPERLFEDLRFIAQLPYSQMQGNAADYAGFVEHAMLGNYEFNMVATFNRKPIRIANDHTHLQMLFSGVSRVSKHESGHQADFNINPQVHSLEQVATLFAAPSAANVAEIGGTI